MKKLILIMASIGGCLILATALALPPGVLVREWSSHIAAGEVVPPEETRTTEEESEPEQQEEPAETQYIVDGRDAAGRK